jgi:small subunit ribosomal protein S4e
MGRKGGTNRTKRQMAPPFWDIRRKVGRFVVRVNPGPHPKRKSYPLGVILRDILKVARTMYEAGLILNHGKIKVDGVTIRDKNRAIGLMDILELTPTKQCYRIVPKDSHLLYPLSIDPEASSLKLVKVTSKTTIKNGRLQYGFHDGKTLISDRKMAVGDSCLIQVPEIKIVDHIRFEKGSLVLITGGDNAGSVGVTEDIKDGIFSLPRRAIVAFADRSVELPVGVVMAVGSDKPVVKVS